MKVLFQRFLYERGFSKENIEIWHNIDFRCKPIYISQQKTSISLFFFIFAVPSLIATLTLHRNHRFFSYSLFLLLLQLLPIHRNYRFFIYSLFILLLQLLPIHRNHRFFTYSLFILLLQLLLYIEIKKFVLNRCKSHNLPILSPVLFLL